MSDRRRRPAKAAIASLCLLGAAGLGASLHGVRGEVDLDRLSSRILGPPSPVSGPTALRLAQLSGRGPIVVALLLLGGWAGVRYRSLRPVVAIGGAAALAQGSVILGKRLVDRTLFSSGTSYPSGHVAGATVVLVLALLVSASDGFRTRLLVGTGLGALLVGTALGALWTQSHVLTDVIGGGLVGTGASWLTWVVVVPDGLRPRRRTTARDKGDPSVLVAGRNPEDVPAERPPGA